MGFIFIKNPSLSESQINFIKTFIFFNTFNKVFQIKFTKKQSNNIISGIHAFSSLFLSGSNNIKDLKWFTSAYFVYDLLQIKKLTIMNLAYIYHHLSGLYLLSHSEEVAVVDMLFWGELSNLSSYPLYYYLHQAVPAPSMIIFFQILQKILYTGIRIPILTLKLIQYLKKSPNYKHLFAIVPVYLMGIIWGKTIIKQKLYRKKNIR